MSKTLNFFMLMTLIFLSLKSYSQGMESPRLPEEFECDDFEILDRKLTGQINGQQWNFRSGFATRKLILLFNNSVTACDPLSLRNRNYVRINVRPGFKAGSYDLQNPEGADYVIDVKNIKDGVPCYGCLACGQMDLKINERTEVLTGEIHAQWMDGDYVNGSFRIPLCFDFETE